MIVIPVPVVVVGIGLAGLLISFLNYLSNRQFQKRKDQREQEEHELKIAKLRGHHYVEQD